ncbi:MAG: AI-2E family transporter [Sulfuricurvum sp.]|uniref:AI-2E family transporter n=1 Tax=Sulfuricurvum sp. TaxID=2025608 RepID=UPI0026319B5C|nr:AI-2E family transporter [Sulfuricurvum sp.]MDD2828312.1 AI-2E family transporter [Sulfuricurvum sp.]MDD4949733.1 AI-2E family transporter [Sulfuricurvum sp.]
MEHNLFVRSLIFITFGLFIWLFLPFLNSFVVALLLVTAFTPIHLWMEGIIQKKPFLNANKALWSASIMTLLLFIVLFVPIIFFIVYIATHPSELIQIGNTFATQITKIASHLPDSLHWLQEYVDQGIAKTKEHQTQIATTLAINLGNGVLGFLGAVGDMILIITFFFFLSWYRRPILLSISPVIPMRRKIRQEFILDMIATSAAGFYTLVGVAIAQGLAFGIFISFFDNYNPWLFGLLIAVTSVIPIFGTALIFVPVALNEWFSGNGMNALIIVIYSWAMLSFFIDNIVRLLILQQLNRYLSQGRKPIDDFLIFFSIMAGLVTFGFWGFLIGPAIVAFTVTLLRVLRRNHITK